MSSFIAFRSAAISLLRRPYTRTLTAQSTAPPPPKTKWNKNAALEAAAAKKEKPAKNQGPLRGHKIPYRLVRLVDPDTGTLSGFTPLRSILATLDERSHYLELVTDTPVPVVKIFNRYVETTRAAEAAHRAREVARQNIQKEVQLSWASAPADLAHKINKVREDILRGARVDLVFARKKGQALLWPDEMNQRATEAIESLLDIAKEWKPRDLRPNQSLLAVFLEGTGTPEVAAAAADTVDIPSQPEIPGKKLAVSFEFEPKEQGDVVRRMCKELAKGTRVELVIAGKRVQEKADGSHAPANNLTKGVQAGAQVEDLSVDELYARANKLTKDIQALAKEWREREYRPNSAKLSVFLESTGYPTKGKVVVHKGPKPKKLKPGDIPDLFQD